MFLEWVNTHTHTHIPSDCFLISWKYVFIYQAGAFGECSHQIFVQFLSNFSLSFMGIIFQMINAISWLVVGRMVHWLCGHRMDRWSGFCFKVLQLFVKMVMYSFCVSSILGLIQRVSNNDRICLTSNAMSTENTQCIYCSKFRISWTDEIIFGYWSYSVLLLCLWGIQVAEKVDMARHYACSMDIHSSYQTLLVCGVAKVSWRLLVLYNIFRFKLFTCLTSIYKFFGILFYILGMCFGC